MTRTTGLLFAVMLATGIAWWAMAGVNPDGVAGAPPAVAPGLPSTRPTINPLPALEPLPLPDKYKPLLNRNLFAVGRSSTSARSRQEAVAPVPEDRFALRGIMHQSGQFTALIEDTSTRQVRRLFAGESIARGRLSDVSFDGLRYEAEGRDTRVAIGEKLSGALAIDPVVAKPEKHKPADEATPAEGERHRERSKSAEKVAS
ncbi:hypothetical protein [Humisphaera borealis]|uniref:Type II secretion system protein GspC N-terminal domain-containing protein n=1 Tax=Humisphaera borealis TaxID=2807512 RepID=A0A7M2WSF2_9BACT|nr:hypothetical protein [Humisphaera borealis]QOV88112.1 hypothetical protein IPV69_17845 [Humisphaera borealis]